MKLVGKLEENPDESDLFLYMTEEQASGSKRGGGEDRVVRKRLRFKGPERTDHPAEAPASLHQMMVKGQRKH